MFWSDSYFITTTGGADIETIGKYIQDQGIEKPKRKYTKRQTKKCVKKTRT
ncbi:MAG: transposase [Lachnospiraceae bacterium]